MGYIFLTLAQTAGVVALACLGVLLGLRLGRLRSRAWILGCIVPLALLCVIAVPRRFAAAAAYPPFRWIQAGRVEFAMMAVICPVLLTTASSRLRRKRDRRALVLLMLVATLYFSVLPFLLPAFTYGEFSRLQTTVDQNGVCRQSNGYTCGPAAAVTVLRRIGIQADESDLALHAYTTFYTGTGAGSLCGAVRDRYGVACRTLVFRSVSELAGKEPFIAVVRHSFLVNHYVAVLRVTEAEVAIGDPYVGLRTCTRRQFDETSRGCAILIEKPTGK